MDRYEDRGRPLMQAAPVPSAPVMPVNNNGVTPAMNGLFGRMTQQANAASAGLPGFNYVPPQVGPPPVPVAAPGRTPQELGQMFLAQDPNRMSYQQRRGLNVGFGGQSGSPGYSTSGRGGGRSSSWGGAQRGGGGLY
jgi:hypothetical protein